MPRFMLTLEYHGAPFIGWQRQASGRSVQAVVEDALGVLEGAPVRIHAAGRTDAGVHASGQVVHADLSRAWAPFRLREALNHHLRPAPVAAVRAALSAADFHARFDAIERHYLYRIVSRRPPLVLEAGLAWQVPRALDIDAMRSGAAYLVGHHDFTTFRAAQCQAKSPVKTLDAITIEQVDERIEIRLRARSFLHNQVRSIVGTLERVGCGAWPPERVGEALAARERRACGPVAPAHGLYLTRVIYPSAAL